MSFYSLQPLLFVTFRFIVLRLGFLGLVMDLLQISSLYPMVLLPRALLVLPRVMIALAILTALPLAPALLPCLVSLRRPSVPTLMVLCLILWLLLLLLLG